MVRCVQCRRRGRLRNVPPPLLCPPTIDGMARSRGSHHLRSPAMAYCTPQSECGRRLACGLALWKQGDLAVCRRLATCPSLPSHRRAGSGRPFRAAGRLPPLRHQSQPHARLISLRTRVLLLLLLHRTHGGSEHQMPLVFQAPRCGGFYVMIIPIVCEL